MKQKKLCLLLGLWGAMGATLFAAAGPLPSAGPVKVQIVPTNGGFQLYVARHPFYIKGAGLETGSMEKLVEHGGNSFRTWRADGGLLDRAQAHGLYVTMGLAMGRERLGFNYDDPVAVAQQRETIRQEVLAYRNRPALIIWAIGNELNLEAANPAVWNAVNDVSRMIHELDTNHLTTTPLAGFNPAVVREVQTRAPDLDLLSFQMYGDIVNLPRYLRAYGWQAPYLVTEWGATGHWEVGRTSWGAPIENDSTTKANFYEKRFEQVIQADPNECLGSYVFLWGHKQERTPTWYGMFLASGEETAAVDVMQYVWTGQWPAARSPELTGAWLDGKTARQSIHLKSGQNYAATVRVKSGNLHPLSYVWEVLPESTDLKTGGDFESRPQSLPGLITPDGTGGIVLKAPEQAGAYRLFAYVFDGQGHAAHVNIPFFLDKKPSLAEANPAEAGDKKE